MRFRRILVAYGDLTTKEEHLDKDVYRREIGDLIPVYQEVLNRLEKGV